MLSIWKKKVIYTNNGLRVTKTLGNFPFWVNYPFKDWGENLVISIEHFQTWKKG